MMISWKKRIGVVSGNTLEYYDIAVYAAISGYIAINFFPDDDIGKSLIFTWGVFALRFLTRPIGGFLVGLYADKFGRKSALVFTSTLIGLATITMAMLPTYDDIGLYAPLALLALQLIQSFCFGGEFPVVMSYLMADGNCSERQRSRVSSLIVSSSMCGVVLLLIVTLLVQLSLSEEDMREFGWRIPLMVGVFNVLISYYFKLRLPEIIKREEGEQTLFIDKKAVFRVFLICIPGGVMFYVNAMVGQIVMRSLSSSSLLSIFPMISNTLLIIAFLAVGWFSDKYSTPERVIKIGIYSLIFLATPCYLLLRSAEFFFIVLGQTGIVIISALIIAPICAVIYKQAKEGFKTTTIGLGFNLALSIFGGLTPFLISLLSEHPPVLTGMFISCTGIFYLLAGIFVDRTKSYQRSVEPDDMVRVP